MWRIAMVGMWLVVGSVLWTVPSQAAPLDPLSFTSLGILNTTDTISINTDTLQLTGGVSYTGVLDPVSGAGIFTFDGISGTNISIFGTRTLGLLPRANVSSELVKKSGDRGAPRLCRGAPSAGGLWGAPGAPHVLRRPAAACPPTDECARTRRQRATRSRRRSGARRSAARSAIPLP